MSLKETLKEKIGKIDKEKALKEKEEIKKEKKAKTLKEKKAKVTEKQEEKEKILNKLYALRLTCEIINSTLKNSIIISDTYLKFSDKIDKDIFNTILITVKSDIKKQLVKETNDNYYIKMNFALTPTQSVPEFPEVNKEDIVTLDSKNIVPQTSEIFDDFCKKINKKEKTHLITPVDRIAFISKYNPLVSKEKLSK